MKRGILRMGGGRRRGKAAPSGSGGAGTWTGTWTWTGAGGGSLPVSPWRRRRRGRERLGGGAGSSPASPSGSAASSPPSSRAGGEGGPRPPFPADVSVLTFGEEAEEEAEKEDQEKEEAEKNETEEEEREKKDGTEEDLWQPPPERGKGASTRAFSALNITLSTDDESDPGSGSGGPGSGTRQDGGFLPRSPPRTGWESDDWEGGGWEGSGGEETSAAASPPAGASWPGQLLVVPRGLEGRTPAEEMAETLGLPPELAEGALRGVRCLGSAGGFDYGGDGGDGNGGIVAVVPIVDVHGVEVPDYRTYVVRAVDGFRKRLGISDRLFVELQYW